MKTNYRGSDIGNQLWSCRLLCYKRNVLTASEYEESVQFNFPSNRNPKKIKITLVEKKKALNKISE